MRSLAAILFPFLVLFLQVADAGQAGAQTPAAAMPTLHGDHPRLFFTAGELPALRDRIARDYRAEFQDFVNLLNDTGALSRRQKGIEANWGGFNYAFVAALDPQEMSRRGFRFKSELSTARAYCDRAMAYNRQLLPGVAAAEDQRGGTMNTGYPVPKYLSVVTTYDWCHPYLSDTDRQAIVDAYVAAYRKRHAGRDLLSAKISGLEMIANERASNDVDSALGILGFAGDPYPAEAVQHELLAAFKTLWLDRYLVELNHFYRPATGWHEGPGGYLANAYMSASVPVAMFSSALGVDYIAETPFFSEYAVFAAANTRPHSLLEWAYYDRWGTISDGISGPSCKNLMLNAGMLGRAGHPNAALAKWTYEKTAGYCKDTVTTYGGTWSNAVLFWFLYGDREVEPRSPVDMKLPNSVRLGLGQYVMRSGYGPSDSQAIFYAQEHRMYGHATPQYGTFSLHKFGNLILQPGNTKSGEGELQRGPDKGALLQNLVTLHKGSSDTGLGFDGKRQPDPVFAPRGISQVGKAGTIFAETLGVGFDYVGYDNLPMWNTSTVTTSQREFVYLHGSMDKEFLVILDRLGAANPSADEKVWRIWVPTQPAFVNGTESTPRPGKWTSTDSDTISLTNKFSALAGKNFRSAGTHGRFFMKALLPDRPVINFLGGPGMEFQSGNDDGTMPWGTPPMTQAEREYLGWGRVEVRPSVRQGYDVFLNVIQFGDANTLESMAPISRVESTDRMLTGTHVGDAANQWVVMLARRASDQFQVREAAYSFRAVAPGSRQLLLDMARSTTFHVRVSKAGGDTKVEVGAQPVPGSREVASNDHGVLSFEVDDTQVR